MSTASSSALRRHALGLLGPAHAQPEIDSDDWIALDALLQIHRLRPHVHGRLKRGELAVRLPKCITDGWAAAHRSSAISALAHKAELFALARLLTKHGMTSVALKGAGLAWHAYPTPAERPVRDLDVLVSADQADEAFSLLLANGYMLEEGGEEYGKHHRHKPPLIAPSGVRIELHSALRDDSSLRFEGDFIRGRISGGATDDPASYPAASDMLLHLVLHAAYGEVSLDVGPLLLCDVDYLIETSDLDWQCFWQRCEELHITRGAALVLAVTDRWRRPGLTEKCPSHLTVPEAILTSAPDLLLQDPTTRKSASLIASFGADPILPAKRILAGLTTVKSGSYAKWLGRRLGQSARQITNPEVRQTGAALGQLGEWLKSAE